MPIAENEVVLEGGRADRKASNEWGSWKWRGVVSVLSAPLQRLQEISPPLLLPFYSIPGADKGGLILGFSKLLRNR